MKIKEFLLLSKEKNRLSGLSALLHFITRLKYYRSSETCSVDAPIYVFIPQKSHFVLHYKIQYTANAEDLNFYASTNIQRIANTLTVGVPEGKPSFSK